MDEYPLSAGAWVESGASRLYEFCKAHSRPPSFRSTGSMIVLSVSISVSLSSYFQLLRIFVQYAVESAQLAGGTSAKAGRADLSRPIFRVKIATAIPAGRNIRTLCTTEGIA